ncbi:MAG: transglutaminase-like domain-containing protein [Candidatus Shapirobacteria bacterium]|nr:transglutaminase-like domain-containing protein [Candidatus Shapirobacteria bacterium]
MQKPSRPARLIFLAIIFLFLTVNAALAQNEFAISQTIRYQINEKGQAQISHEVSMTNNFSSIYATQYSLTITGSSQLIKNITASSEGRELNTEVDRSNRALTKITVFFNPPVTGKDKTNQFKIDYQIDDFVENVGQTKRVTIPKINDIAQLDETQLIISAPKNFGPPSFVSPKNFQEKADNNQTVITFAQTDLFEKEVMAIFGDVQLMQFDLKYFLENPDNQPSEEIIALPPDTSYQKIFLTELDPQPKQVLIDEDGNWLALYTLAPQEKIDIMARGVAQITAEAKNSPIEPENFSVYLKEDRYWETGEIKIKTLAQNLKTIDQIYHYVVTNLQYSLDRVKNRQISRQGALLALENPDQAICTEFTDLFIALARAAGIPAREINGYAYSANPQMLPSSLYADVLHSWPEYWDSNTNSWRQVDPTWESTSNIDYFNKMDMAHLALAIHGKSSQFPLPAGAYQREKDHQKSVNIAFTQNLPDLSLKNLIIEDNLPKEITVGQNLTGEITITNPNNRALYQLEVEMVGQGLGISPKRTTIAALPPFGKTTIPITVYNQSFWGQPNSHLIVNATSGNFINEKLIPIHSLSPISWQTLVSYWPIVILVIILLGTGIFIARKKRRKNN